MNAPLLRALKQWRSATARKEGVELFRVLSNKSLDDLAEKVPRSVSDMLGVYGIKERKFQRYGPELLDLIEKTVDGSSAGEGDSRVDAPEQDQDTQEAQSVSAFLDSVNDLLCTRACRVQGEVGSVDVRGSYLFFSLKDSQDGSVMNCFMWAREYALSGVKLEEGIEIIIQGIPEIYKPSGRFTVRVSTVELVGEGALKVAYDKLKMTLEAEGVFSDKRKRPLPEYPEAIGVITSKTGAVIHDFLNNLGKFGYKIQLFNSRVEGASATRDILSGLKYFSDKKLDILVLIRGGGSLESLQAFNNETIVRAIAEYPVPVICGIGHDKDVPLVSLAADKMVSTPTAATVTINEGWQQALKQITFTEEKLLRTYEGSLKDVSYQLKSHSQTFEGYVRDIVNSFAGFQDRLLAVMDTHKRAAVQQVNEKTQLLEQVAQALRASLHKHGAFIVSAERLFTSADPRRLLKLGYSIVKGDAGLVRSVSDVKSGEMLEVQVTDGTIESSVVDIIQNNNENYGKGKSKRTT